jgi:hypothetical protein
MVNDMVDVIQIPARPALVNPPRANKVVTKMITAPRESNQTSNHLSGDPSAQFPTKPKENQPVIEKP